MPGFHPLAAVAALASFTLAPVALAQGAPVKIYQGKMIYGANGHRFAPVYRVNTDGTVQLIMAGRLLTIPTTILYDVNGRLISSQNRGALLR